jgi:hypothetical protein
MRYRGGVRLWIGKWIRTIANVPREARLEKILSRGWPTTPLVLVANHSDPLAREISKSNFDKHLV